MAASLTNSADKRTVRGRTIRYATFQCRVYISYFQNKRHNAKDRSLRLLLHLECISPVGAAEGCDLLIFQSAQTTKATRRWPLLLELKSQPWLTSSLPSQSARPGPCRCLPANARFSRLRLAAQRISRLQCLC